jgi:hypothetical protein
MITFIGKMKNYYNIKGVDEQGESPKRDMCTLSMGKRISQ